MRSCRMTRRLDGLAPLCAACLAFAHPPAASGAEPVVSSEPDPGIPVTVEVTRVERIWDRAPHSAFTDLLDWNGKLICAFREGRGHVSTDGRIRLIASDDGRAWHPLALVGLDGYDLRDADLSIMPDGRMMLLGGAAPRKRDRQRAPTGTFVSFSKDGRDWTAPEIVIEPGRWLWRVTWHDGRAYGFSYPAAQGNHLELLTSEDGRHWTPRATNLVAGQDASEAQIQFDRRGRALALVRRAKAGALLGRSDGDFTHWQWSDLNCAQVWGREPNPRGSEFRAFGGPNFIETLPDVWIGAGRMHEGGAHTALTWLDARSATMQPLLKLPSGGDTSYPGLVWRDGTLFISYYSSHQGRTSIYLAQAKLQRTPHEHIDVARDAGAGSYEAFPDVARLADGRLMCVFYAGYGHVSPPIGQYPRGGRIACCSSEDDGRTWSEPRTLHDGPLDDRDPSVTQLRGGPLLCNFFVSGKGVQLLRSGDGGQTWSEPTRIAPPPYVVSSPVRELSTGRLALAIYHHKRGDVHPAFIWSDDGGRTWSKPVDIDNAGGKSLSESDVIERADGTLWLIQRNDRRGDMHCATSKDQGQTWSASRPVGSPGQAPYLHRAPNGVVLLSYRGPGEPNWGTYLRCSTDECQSWSDPVTIDAWANGAYPSMANLKDGSVLVVYYDDKGYGHGRYRHMSNIRAKRLRVTRDGVAILPLR